MTRSTHLTSLILALAMSAPLAAQEREPLASFVTGGFYHGLPRAQAASYGSEAVPELLEMLNDPSKQAHWDQVIDMLSIVGDARATPVLQEFFEERFEGPVVIDTYQALMQVPRAMGEIAQRGDAQAQAWLERGLMPEDWSNRNISWVVPAVSDADRRLLFSKLNISGLSRVGNQSSLAKLRQTRQNLDARADIQPVLAPALREAIVVNELILERGPGILRGPFFDNILQERLLITPE